MVTSESDKQKTVTPATQGQNQTDKKGKTSALVAAKDSDKKSVKWDISCMVHDLADIN